MKKLFAIVFVILMSLTIGCDDSSSSGGTQIVVQPTPVPLPTEALQIENIGQYRFKFSIDEKLVKGGGFKIHFLYDGYYQPTVNQSAGSYWQNGQYHVEMGVSGDIRFMFENFDGSQPHIGFSRARDVSKQKMLNGYILSFTRDHVYYYGTSTRLDTHVSEKHPKNMTRPLFINVYSHCGRGHFVAEPGQTLEFRVIGTFTNDEGKEVNVDVTDEQYMKYSSGYHKPGFEVKAGSVAIASDIAIVESYINVGFDNIAWTIPIALKKVIEVQLVRLSDTTNSDGSRDIVWQVTKKFADGTTAENNHGLSFALYPDSWDLLQFDGDGKIRLFKADGKVKGAVVIQYKGCDESIHSNFDILQ